MKPYTDYDQLPLNADQEDKWEADAAPPATQPAPRMGGATRVLLYCTYLACLTCSCLNIALRLFPAAPPPRVPASPALLERPSVYIDLARVHYGRPFVAAVQPVVNFPHVFGRVSTAQPARVLDEVRRWLTPHGTVHPDEHRVLISQDVSTILQFRVLDYGMERCTLVADIPSEAAIRARARNNNIEIKGNTTAIDVFALAAATELVPAALTKSNQPPRRERVGTLNVTLGMKTQIAEFHCASQSLLSFELACPSRACHVDFWQDNEEPLMGFHVLQSLSLKASV